MPCESIPRLGPGRATPCIEQAADLTRVARAFRAADPMRPLTIDVADDFQRYARSVDPQIMVGIHRWPLMTSMELIAYRDWLTQRRALAGLDAYCWTWIQTHLPDWFTTVAYERDSAAAFNEPIGPQMDQIRLMTYLAAGSGYRGIGYWSDRFLADSHTGRDRLLGLALLNQELKLLEPVLVDAEEPEWIDTTNPDVKAAVIRPRGKPTVLVLPIWVGKGSQFVPAQGTVASLTIKVPAVPLGCQAWEVSPGHVRSLKWSRKLGGNEIVLHEFCLTSAVVFTSDLTGLVQKFQNDQKEMASAAAQWAYDEATEEVAKVERVHRELEQLGQKLQDGDGLLKKAHEYLESSLSQRRAGDHAEGWLGEARPGAAAVAAADARTLGSGRQGDGRAADRQPLRRQLLHAAAALSLLGAGDLTARGDQRATGRRLRAADGQSPRRLGGAGSAVAGQHDRCGQARRRRGEGRQAVSEAGGDREGPADGRPGAGPYVPRHPQPDGASTARHAGARQRLGETAEDDLAVRP